MKKFFTENLEKDNKKICIICVYFGKLPNYFSLWLKACRFNPTVDFLLVTDQILQLTLPSNVHLFPYSLDKMRQRASEIFGFSASLTYPYKCCDYKVIYGLLFEDFLSDYAYWGHCDMDLIFGDIRAFTNKYQLEKYDKFLALGHLSLYRNTSEVNNRYKLAGAYYGNKDINYKEVFTNGQNYTFDEVSGIYSIYQRHRFPVFTKRIFADIASVYKRYRLTQAYRLDSSVVADYKYQIFYWEKGKTYRAYVLNNKIYTEEYIYIHFQKRANFTVDFPGDKFSAFYITNTGFYPKKNPVSSQDIKKLNPYHFIYESWENMCYFFYKKLKSLKRILPTGIKRQFL